MTSRERWQRVQELCETLEAIPPLTHRDHLEKIEADASLRGETLALLEAVRDEECAQREHAEHEAVPAAPPQPIGGIHVLERLGAGGSGEVFRAVRTVNGVEQAVAIKHYHAHRAGPEHLARFAREQRMLAALTHPDIVRFLDAGLTGDGRPYLVMELAEGQPITRYCDDTRLKLPERLRLMASVCDAVQAAHRHLIVHLDLKPSNILVTAEGRIKLLDFGAAKLVDPLADVTRTEPLTLLYASPERLRGDPVSVACDVYSLGLILYELATGAWPFHGRDSLVSVAERATGNVETTPPSRTVTAEAARVRGASPERLRALLRGDLDAICAKSLAHEPADRYASAADLSEDLRRYQAGEPVRARALGVGYRVRKFVRRHTWAVAATVTLVVGLAAAAVYSAGQARVARVAASRAQAESEFLASLFTLTGADSASRHDMTVRDLLALAESRVTPSLGADPAAAADIETALARGFASQNAYPSARALYERALARATASNDVARQASARAGLAYVLYVQNRTDEAWEEAIASLEIWKRHRRRFTPAQAVTTLGAAAATLAYVRTTDPVHREYYEACLQLSRAFPLEAPASARANCLLGLATSYTMIDSRYEEAEPLLHEALAIHRTDPTAASALATTLQMYGLVSRFRGRFAEDERAQRESYDITARLNGPESVAALWQRAVWASSLIGVDRAEEAYRESQPILAAARSVYPTRGSYLMWTPLSTAMAASCVTARHPECESLSLEAIDTLGPTPSDNDPRLQSARGFLGLALASRGEYHQARSLLEGALALNATRKRVPPYTPLLEAALAKSVVRP